MDGTSRVHSLHFKPGTWFTRVHYTAKEGLAMRPGPRPRLAKGLLAVLREALKACRVITFRYRTQSTRCAGT